MRRRRRDDRIVAGPAASTGRSTGELLVEVGGVGYRVQSGPVTAARLGDLQGEVFVWIHHHVREDAATLYGFATRGRARRASRRCSAPTASGRRWRWRSCRSTRRPRCARVLADDDVAALCLVPGVGKKTAARLLVELSPASTSRSTACRRLDDGGTPAPGPASTLRRRPRRARRARLRARRDRRGAPRLPDDGDAGGRLREALRRLAAGAALTVRDELLTPGRSWTRSRSPTRPACARSGSTSSSARPSSRSTCRSSSRRPGAAGQAADHLLLRRAARPGQDHARRHRRRRDGRRPARHVRPGARAGRRPGRRSSPQLERGRRALHRRDPPPGPAGRGGALPGDGGLPARHRPRQGPGRPLDPPRRPARSRSSAPPPAPGSSPGRCATASASSPGSTTTSRPTSRPSCSRAAGILDVERRRRRRRRDRPPRPGHAAHRQPPAAPGARLRRGARRRRRRRRRRPRRACTCSASTSAASTRSTARSSRALCERFGGGPVGLRRSPSAWPSRPRPSRTSTSRSSSSEGLLMRTPRGRVATPAAWEHLGLERAAAPADREPPPGLFG